MLPDFEMVIHTIPTKENITLFTLFDLHFGSRECMEEEFRQFINMIANTPNAYVIIGGDICDNGLKNSLTNVYRATRSPSAQKREVAELLKPIRDRILFWTDGNHERRSSRDSDDNVGYDICTKLDIEHLYRENMGFLKIVLGEQYTDDGVRSNSKYRPSYTFCISHGAGGGALSGGVLNRNERAGYFVDGIDAIIVGHSHKPMLSQPGKIVVDNRNNKVSVVPFKVIVASSWLRYGDYAAQKLLLPTSHVIQKIILSAYHKEMFVTM